jgi:hypothetical protein
VAIDDSHGREPVDRECPASSRKAAKELLALNASARLILFTARRSSMTVVCLPSSFLLPPSWSARPLSWCNELQAEL